MIRNRSLPIVLAVALSLSACATDDSTNSSTSISALSTSTNPSQSGPTPNELAAALVTPGDLGAGWQTMQSQTFTSRDGIPVVDSSIWCPSAMSSMASLASLAGNQGSIIGLRAVGLARGRSHQITEQLWSGPYASDFVNQFARGVLECEGKPWTDAEGSGVVLDSLEVDTFGEVSASAIVVVTATEAGTQFVYRTRISVARIGDVVMILNEADAQEAGTAPLWSTDEWRSKTETIVSRIPRP